LNLAVADVRALAWAFHRFFGQNAGEALTSYSSTCLPRVWKAQRFSWWMTSLLHRSNGDFAGFDYRRQLAELDYLTSSRAAMTSLAENYVGLPIDIPLP
jgi:p-hydroxybenzoate 3-monooxygenase